MSKIKEIASGWKNYFFRTMTIETMAKIRRHICEQNDCGFYKTAPVKHCGHCDCPMAMKLRSVTSACPVGLWGVSDEVQLTITKELLLKVKFKTTDGVTFVKKGFMITYMKGKVSIPGTDHKDITLWKELREIYWNRTNTNIF